MESPLLRLDPESAAASAGLRYITDATPGIRRRRSGEGFIYRLPDGAPMGKPHLERIRKLAIPPAWTEVWICPDPRGHLQATGRDAKGRKQHLYHPDYRASRDATKFAYLAAFAQCLPRLRRRVRQHMSLPGLPREKVLALTVYLLEATLIRIGNESYARDNKSFGLTTLRNRHLAIRGAELRFRFTGKSGRAWTLSLQDRRIARIMRACQELPGQDLLQYRDTDGTVQKITSTDVNAYLRELTGADITAKDFRTWAGTVLAARALQALEAVESVTAGKRRQRQMINEVAERLGNTPTVCRKCYIHPVILGCFVDPVAFAEARKTLEKGSGRVPAGLRRAEAMTLHLLKPAAPAAAPAAHRRKPRRSFADTAQLASAA